MHESESGGMQIMVGAKIKNQRGAMGMFASRNFGSAMGTLRRRSVSAGVQAGSDRKRT